MTLSDDGKTATMESMPAFDATVNYDIVRDMAVSMTTKVGDGEDGADYRIRLKKKDSKWELADLTVDQVMALFKVHDAIENKDLAFSGDGAVCAISIYALDDQNQPTGEAVAFADLEPGRYVAIAKAVGGSAYDGQTAQSNAIVLFQGYEVTVPAGEFITYYKEEPLRLDDADKETIELYTVSSVSETTATLSGPYDAMPKNTPMFVRNKGTEDKTFYLIPCNDPDLALSVYSGFQGTLEPTTIAASTSTVNNYAFNGTAFVWVKNDLEVGANKCWLSIGASSARTMNIVFDETTGISTTNFTNYTNSAGAWYSLDGRKLQGKPNRKGVYIKNGKKVVVK